MAVLALICGGCAAGGAIAATDSRDNPTVLVFGDSLSAGYGMASQEAWPALLAQTLQAQPATARWKVVNASVSGETTHGGATRLPAALALHHPQVVILELGGNDALRGQPLENMQRELISMVRKIRQAGARTLLVGIALPPNFGDDFTTAFAGVYTAVARSEHAPLVPNLVAALGTGREDFQADGIHPLPRVQNRLLQVVLPALKPLLR